MVRRRFDPRIDGIACPLKNAWEPPAHLVDSIGDNCNQVLKDTLASLQLTYGGMAKICQTEKWLQAWVKIGIADSDLFRAGYLQTVLDYYHSWYSIPEKYLSENSKQARRFRSRLEQRTLDSLRVNLGKQLLAIAICCFIPSAEELEEGISDAVRKEITSIGTYLGLEISFSLQVAKSGTAWLKQTTIREWSVLKKNLDKKEPRLLSYFVRTPNRPLTLKTVIAYDYQRVNRQFGRIYIYDTDAPGRYEIIRIGLNPGEEGLPTGRQIVGFYLEEHHATRVPTSFWYRIIDFFSNG